MVCLVRDGPQSALYRNHTRPKSRRAGRNLKSRRNSGQTHGLQAACDIAEGAAEKVHCFLIGSSRHSGCSNARRSSPVSALPFFAFLFLSLIIDLYHCFLNHLSSFVRFFAGTVPSFTLSTAFSITARHLCRSSIASWASLPMICDISSSTILITFGETTLTAVRSTEKANCRGSDQGSPKDIASS